MTQVVAVGTKTRPTTPTTPTTPTGGNKPAADGLNWAALAECESGGDPTTNTGNGFYGLYQFDEQTWHSVGGSGLPHENSAGEQTYRAQILYKDRGDSPLAELRQPSLQLTASPAMAPDHTGPGPSPLPLECSSWSSTTPPAATSALDRSARSRHASA